MNKKKILKTLGLVGCAILLVVGSVAGTFAYLTSTTATVENTFTAGNVTITMDEAVVDEYGVETTGRTDEGNEYKLIPGHTYTKDPTIYVGADSEECYVFFKLENGLGDDATIIIDNAKWLPLAGATGVYYYTEVATAGNEYVAFTEFTLATDADVETLEDKTIKITAYAVQADGVTGANIAEKAANAWANGQFGN